MQRTMGGSAGGARARYSRAYSTKRGTAFIALVSLLVLLARGAHASGVDPTKVSLPKGPGSIEGLATADLAPSMANGSSSYEIAIGVPPGSADFGPKLSLAYDSGGGLTEIGIGWRIRGAPKVRRRTENGLPRFDETDTFELVGLGVPCDLVEVDTNVFRPSVEDGSFVRLERSADGATWEARTKAGPTLLFGGDGFVEREGAHVAAYLLREERDRHGHVVAYEWDTAEGHALLTRVSWNAFDAASQNEVRFAYESRPDAHRAFSSGIVETLSRRLHTVTVTHGGALVRRYELGYGSEAHPALRSVDLVGSDGITRMPDSRFDYTEAHLLATAAEVVTMRQPPGQSPSDANVALADLDGDGLPDLLVGAAGRFRSYINRDGKAWATPSDWGSASPSVSLSASGVQLADVDADGAADLVVKSGNDSFRFFPGGQGARFAPPVTIKSVPGFTFEDPDVRIADMDGDRRVDVVVTTEAGVAVGYNLNGADWTEPVLVGPVVVEDVAAPVRFSDGQTSLCDVNGDRMMDLCALHPGGMTYFLGRGRGVFEHGAAAVGVPDFDAASPFQLVDLNGDGWGDLVRVSATQIELAVATGEGSFGEVETIGGTPTRGPATAVEFADMNASGTTDVVWVDVSREGSAAWRYLELFPDGRAGLLARIDNGLGKVQAITYGAAALDAARARDAGEPWQTRMNVAIPVVVRTTTELSLGDPTVTTEWSYRDGAYDTRDRTFAGFGRAVRRQLGDDSTPTLAIERTFDTGLLHRELRGAMLTEELRDDGGSVFSRVTRTYTTRTLQLGLDGTAVGYSFPSSELLEHVEGDPSAARTVLSESDQDDYGNVTEQRSWGEVRGADLFVGNDESREVRTFANDPEEWLLGFVATEELTDGAGKRVAFSRRFYDGAPMRGLPLGQVTRGEVSRQEAWVGPSKDDFELVIATRYDADGLPTETTDGRGGGRFFEWAADHTSIATERVKLEGDVVLVEKASIDGAFGVLLAATDYSGQTTRYEYDPFGRLSAIIKPGDSSDEPTVSYSYDARAPLSRVVTDMRVNSGARDVEHSEVLFDGGGRKRGTLTRDGDHFILAGVTLFDARGNVRRTLLPRAVGAAEYREPPLLDGSPRGSDAFFDARGREIRSRSPSGIESRTVHAPLEVQHYDGGQVDAESSYEHTPAIERRDGLGRVVEHVRTLEGSPLSARYTYDAAGHLLSRTDPEGNVSRYGYDGRGRRTSVRDPDLGEHHFSYDATGNVVERRFADGVVARFGFDLAGRSLSEDWNGDGTPEIIRTWDQSPDGGDDAPYRGRLARVTEPSGYVEHAYDARGRVTVTRYEIDGVAYVTRSAYDAQDREIRHTYPDGSSLEVHRNPRGQISAYGSAVAFEYAEDGLETARRLSSGASIVTAYDDERRRAELTAVAATGSTIEHLRWTYDPGGNLRAVEDLRPNVSPEQGRSETYDYDNLYRLVGAKGAWGETTYRYSASGNLLGRKSTVGAQDLGAVTYGVRPHLPARLGARAVLADARGRMLTDGERDYTWNDADQLVKVSGRDGVAVDSAFGADGARRIRVEHRADGSSSTTHFIDAWSEAKDGKLTRYIVHAGQRIVRLGDDAVEDGLVAKPTLAGLGPVDAGRARWPNPNFGATALAIAVLGALCAAKRIRVVRAARFVVTSMVALAVFAACRGDGKPAQEQPLSREVHQLRDADTFIVTDLLGSLLDEAPVGGETAAAFATYPFGATRYDTSSATWKYASSPRDGAVGLDHMGARFYAPDLGIWTSPDPVALTDPERLVGAEFAAANPYAYANQTPLIAADRDGRFWHIAVGAAVGALIGGGGEAYAQYHEYGHIEDIGRIGAAAAGGAVGGAIMAAAPGILVASAATVGEGITRRLIESHGRSAGTLHDIVVDAAVGMARGGLNKAAGTVLKAIAPAVTTGSKALSRAVGGSAAEGGAEALGGSGSQTFEILDGVRRAKAAQLSGLETIPAEVDVGGRTVAATDVPLTALRSPKSVIDTVTQPNGLQRWFDTLQLTAGGSTPPPIRITLGANGTPIDLVRIGKP